MDPSTETEQQRHERENREYEEKRRAERLRERFEDGRVMLRVAFGGVAFNALVQRGVNLPDALKQVSSPANIAQFDAAIANLFMTPVK